MTDPNPSLDRRAFLQGAGTLAAASVATTALALTSTPSLALSSTAIALTSTSSLSLASLS